MARRNGVILETLERANENIRAACDVMLEVANNNSANSPELQYERADEPRFVDKFVIFLLSLGIVFATLFAYIKMIYNILCDEFRDVQMRRRMAIDAPADDPCILSLRSDDNEEKEWETDSSASTSADVAENADADNLFANTDSDDDFLTERPKTE